MATLLSVMTGSGESRLMALSVLASGVTMVYSGSKDVGRLKLALHWYASSLKTNNESDCSPPCRSLYVLYNYMDGWID